MIKHSGFICLDIDPQHNPGIDCGSPLRDTLAGMDEVFFAALSASGKGSFALVRIADPFQHRGHFEALSRDFLKIGLNVDQNCKDVSRLRGMSYDPAS